MLSSWNKDIIIIKIVSLWHLGVRLMRINYRRLHNYCAELMRINLMSSVNASMRIKVNPH